MSRSAQPISPPAPLVAALRLLRILPPGHLPNAMAHRKAATVSAKPPPLSKQPNPSALVQRSDATTHAPAAAEISTNTAAASDQRPSLCVLSSSARLAVNLSL